MTKTTRSSALLRRRGTGKYPEFSRNIQCSRTVITLKNIFYIFIAMCAVGHSVTVAAQPPIKELLGRWDLTVITPTGDLPSWIEISEEEGSSKILMVGISDHATPLHKVDIHGSEIDFVSPKGEEGFTSDMQFRGKLIGHDLEGTVTDTAGTSWRWKGRRAPQLKRKTNPEWEQPINLFNGKNLTRWTLRNPSKSGTWKVADGTLVSLGNGSDLISSFTFEDFRLHIEFNCGPKSNSGVYLRGRYELQVETDSIAEPNSHHTGGVYGFLDPKPEQPRKSDEWQAFDITLVGRTLTVVQNGTTVIDHQEIPGITGGALDSNEGQPGPIYLQGSEEGRVAYRNIILTPAKY
jgi:Domain of Unknown Function (DUF1080)